MSTQAVLPGIDAEMSDYDSREWPLLNQSYMDEFGPIDCEVYDVARRLRITAERLASTRLGDAGYAFNLMLRAVAKVSQVRQTEPNRILNLTSYLYRTYQHEVMAAVNTRRRRETLEGIHNQSKAPTPSVQEELDHGILIEEILEKMDDWMRDTFELRALGHSYEEIAPMRGEDPHQIRTKYNKKLKRLIKEIRR